MSSSTSSSRAEGGGAAPDHPAAKPSRTAKRQGPVGPPSVHFEPGEGRRLALRIAIAFAIVLLLFEVVTRTFLFPASKDFSRFAKYPARARALSDAAAPRVALYGNSATERGVDMGVLARELGTVGVGGTQDMFVADASHLSTWYWMLEQYLWKPGSSADLVVIHYYNGLADGGSLEVPRLALFFTSREDWPAVFRDDLTELDRRADFVLSSFWATFAARDRIRERILDFIPGYQPYIQAMNAVNFRNQREVTRKSAAPAKKTYRELARLLDRARAKGTPLALVAFPIHPAEGTPLYEVTDEERGLVEHAGMHLVDLHRMPELAPTHYEDEIHLTAEGRAIYTPRLAGAIRVILERLRQR